MKIHYVIAIHRMRWQTDFYDYNFKWTATVAIGIHPTKAYYLSKMGIKIVPHPPHSPDLAPCDFCLFPKLTGCHETIEEMKEAVTKVIDTRTQEDFHGAFQKLLERYKWIAAGGDYFEGD